VDHRPFGFVLNAFGGREVIAKDVAVNA
jgi:hypothetical protein